MLAEAVHISPTEIHGVASSLSPVMKSKNSSHTGSANSSNLAALYWLTKLDVYHCTCLTTDNFIPECGFLTVTSTKPS